MPTWKIKGYTFYFRYSEPVGKPAHIHVITKRGEVQFWLKPLQLKKIQGNVNDYEQTQVVKLVLENIDLFLAEWNKTQSK